MRQLPEDNSEETMCESPAAVTLQADRSTNGRSQRHRTLEPLPCLAHVLLPSLVSNPLLLLVSVFSLELYAVSLEDWKLPQKVTFILFYIDVSVRL